MISIRENIVMVLSLSNYQFLQAASGNAAFGIIAKQHVDGIVLDLSLPDMDGFSVCRELRTTSDADIPSILVTANMVADIEEKAMAVSITATITKPFELVS